MEEGAGDVLPEVGGGDGLPRDGGADVLAGGGVGAGVLAGGVADGLVEEGIDGEEETGEDGALDLSWLLVLEPATQSVSKFLVRSVTTLALIWNVPQERPFCIV